MEWKGHHRPRHLWLRFSGGVPSHLPRSIGTGDEHLDDYLHLGSWGGSSNGHALGPGSYGFNWWFNSEGRLFPEAPHELVMATGAWHKKIFFFPSSQTLVVAGEHWKEFRDRLPKNSRGCGEPARSLDSPWLQNMIHTLCQGCP